MRYYSLRFSLIPSADFEEKMDALLEFCKDAAVDDVMFFVSAEEVNTGHVTIEEAKRHTDVILRAKRILQERGITISLNPWCTFSHYDGGRTLKDGQDFRLMVDKSGLQAKRVVCPLCEKWRAYFVELMNFYVETLQPTILWLEDDFRMVSHDPITVGCFCDEHMKLFNAAAGTSYDRETFISKIFTDDNVRKAYLDVTAHTLKDTLQFISDNVKGQRTFGLMTGGSGQHEGRKYQEFFSILGDKREKPYNRICLHSYRQRGMQEYAWSFNENSMLARKVTGDAAFCVSEMENFPHTMYTKTATYFKYQLLTSAPLCLTGDTLSIFEFNGNGIVNGKKYAKVLKDAKPYLSRLGKIGIQPSDMVGVRILYCENSAYTTKTNSFSFSLFDGWLFAYLTQLGIACSYTSDIHIRGQVVGVSGQVLRNLTKAQVQALFENNYVILTGDNIEVLKDMDLLSLIGANGYERYGECQGLYTMEQDATGSEILGIQRMRATAQFFCGDYFNVQYVTENRTTYTHLLDYNEEKAGDGIVRVNRALVFPYANTRSDQRVPISLLNPLREYAIKSALAANGVNEKQLYFVREENVCIYAFDKGDIVYLVCVNFVDDDYEHLYLKTPYPFENVKIFTPDNDTVRYVSYAYENGTYRINHTLKAQQSYVLVCYKREQDK
ncbi:MAG: hypothetical protein J6A63_02950 [Clostridia bacterium]|nr:hypothetical protein [Clostridia bacterium]